MPSGAAYGKVYRTTLGTALIVTRRSATRTPLEIPVESVATFGSSAAACRQKAKLEMHPHGATTCLR